MPLLGEVVADREAGLAATDHDHVSTNCTSVDSSVKQAAGRAAGPLTARKGAGRRFRPSRRAGRAAGTPIESPQPVSGAKVATFRPASTTPPGKPGGLMPAVWTNWAREQRCAPERIERPRSEEELARAVASAQRVKVAGSGYSFTDIACTDGVMVDLSGMARVLGIEGEDVTVEAGITLRDLGEEPPAARAGHGEPGRRRSADPRRLHLHRHARHRWSLRQPPPRGSSGCDWWTARERCVTCARATSCLPGGSAWAPWERSRASLCAASRRSPSTGSTSPSPWTTCCRGWMSTSTPTTTGRPSFFPTPGGR